MAAHRSPQPDPAERGRPLLEVVNLPARRSGEATEQAPVRFVRRGTPAGCYMQEPAGMQAVALLACSEAGEQVAALPPRDFAGVHARHCAAPEGANQNWLI